MPIHCYLGVHLKRAGKVVGMVAVANRAGGYSEEDKETLVRLASVISVSRQHREALLEAQRTREALARSNAELEQFAFVASHDLQEPLRKIRAFGDRLEAKGGESLTEQGRDYLGRMKNAADRMSTLINDLLMLSRVTTKGQPFAPVDLSKVATEVAGNLETRTEQVGGRVELKELPTVEADPTQMRRLLQNLIGNALKFHREGVAPVVEVRSKVLQDQQQGQLCEIAVKDNGIGFDEKYLDRIFKVFQRLHSRGEYGGTGMGLAICRKILQRHGGSITAKSTPGEGSTFAVTLPLEQSEEGWA